MLELKLSHVSERGNWRCLESNAVSDGSYHWLCSTTSWRQTSHADPDIPDQADPGAVVEDLAGSCQI